MAKRTPKYRPGKRGVAPQVLVRCWLDVPVLGKLMLITGLLRVRGNGLASLSDAIHAIMRGGTKHLLVGASVEDLDAAIDWAATAYPAFSDVLHAVKGAARDAYRSRTGDAPSVTE